VGESGGRLTTIVGRVAVLITLLTLALMLLNLASRSRSAATQTA
jgi:hypothetical protein